MSEPARTASPLHRWLRDVKPIPGGLPVRLLLLVASAIWAWSAAASADVSTGDAVAWAALAIAFVPLAALAAGIVPALGAWVLAFIAFLLLGSPGEAASMMMLPGAMLVAGASWLLPWRAGITVTIALCGALVGIYLRADIEHDPVIIAVLAVLVIAVVLYRPYELYRRRYEQSEAQVASLREQQERARAEERTRLAHELHDIVAHEVTVIAMQSRRNALVGGLNEKASEINRGIGDAAQQTLQDLRRLVLLLQDDEPPAADGLGEMSGETTEAAGLSHDLDRVTEALRRAGVDLHLAVTGDLTRVPLSIRQALRRTVRELSTNILKHADRSQPAQLELDVTAPNVVLRSANALSGARPIISSSTGIEAMRARFEVFGGTVTARASAGLWTTTVTVPLSAQQTQTEEGAP